MLGIRLRLLRLLLEMVPRPRGMLRLLGLVMLAVAVGVTVVSVVVVTVRSHGRRRSLAALSLLRLLPAVAKVERLRMPHPTPCGPLLELVLRCVQFGRVGLVLGVGLVGRRESGE